MRRFAMLVGATAIVLAACGGGGATPTSEATTTEAPTAGTGALRFTIVGEDIAFDVTELRVPAGEEVTIVFDNRDAGVPHNLQIDGPAGPLATEVKPGPDTQTLTVTIDQPGTYRFLCVVHPSRMVGEVVVEG